MTVKEMAAACGCTLLAGGEGEDNQIDGCYIGDLLSWVMARAQSGNVWITVMGNVNAIAVASLADTAGIILVEDAVLDADAKARAEQQEIAVYGTSLPAFETALKIASLLG